jgi:hypothetical protein
MPETQLANGATNANIQSAIDALAPYGGGRIILPTGGAGYTNITGLNFAYAMLSGSMVAPGTPGSSAYYTSWEILGDQSHEWRLSTKGASGQHFYFGSCNTVKFNGVVILGNQDSATLTSFGDPGLIDYNHNYGFVSDFTRRLIFKDSRIIGLKSKINGIYMNGGNLYIDNCDLDGSTAEEAVVRSNGSSLDLKNVSITDLINYRDKGMTTQPSAPAWIKHTEDWNTEFYKSGGPATIAHPEYPTRNRDYTTPTQSFKNVTFDENGIIHADIQGAKFVLFEDCRHIIGGQKTAEIYGSACNVAIQLDNVSECTTKRGMYNWTPSVLPAFRLKNSSRLHSESEEFDWKCNGAQVEAGSSVEFKRARFTRDEYLRSIGDTSFNPRTVI